MGEVVGISDLRARKLARALDRADTVGDVGAINPIYRPGRDAGSIADLIRFAKEGAPPVDCT